MTSRGCSNVQLPKVGRISAMVIAGLSMRLQIMLGGAPKPEPLGVRAKGGSRCSRRAQSAARQHLLPVARQSQPPRLEASGAHRVCTVRLTQSVGWPTLCQVRDANAFSPRRSSRWRRPMCCCPTMHVGGGPPELVGPAPKPGDARCRPVIRRHKNELACARRP